MNIMDELEFLNKKLTLEELHNFLTELMNYSACKLECPSPLTDVEIRDEEGDNVPFYDLIGYKDITIVRNALFLKEKIDEARGEWSGRYDVQRAIKQALGID